MHPADPRDPTAIPAIVEFEGDFTTEARSLASIVRYARVPDYTCCFVIIYLLGCTRRFLSFGPSTTSAEATLATPA